MNPTKNDLPEAIRSKIVDLLNDRLADAIDLQTQCKQAHWNVRGPQFIALHELFDKINEEVEEYVDSIAERGVALGGVVDGTARGVAKRSTLPEYPQRAKAGSEHVEGLATALAAFAKTCRRAITVADEHKDDVTADLFTEIAGGVDKWLWMVEAHAS